MEDELIEGRPELATALIRPVRREVEAFRFSTVRLDGRENTTNLNAALADLWGTSGGTGDAPELGSEAWRAWLVAELVRPLTPGAPTPEPSPEFAETYGMF